MVRYDLDALAFVCPVKRLTLCRPNVLIKKTSGLVPFLESHFMPGVKQKQTISNAQFYWRNVSMSPKH